MCTAWIVAGCLLFGQATPAELAKAQEIEPKVKKLVRTIQDAEAAADRETAVKQLIDMGPSILPYLPKNANDPDLLIRLEQVRVTLEKVEAKQFTEARLVTISAKDEPVSKVLAELAKQGQTEMLDYREKFGEEAADPKISVELKGVPFWKAVDTVLDAAKLTRYPNAETRGVAYQNLADGMVPASGRASYSGPFRIDATEMQIQRNFRRQGAAAVQLNLEVAWEPRLRPMVIYQDLSAVKMEDENGKPLEFDQADATQELSVSAIDMNSTVSLSLAAPPRGVKKIASLKGKLDCLVPSKYEKFEFTNLAAKTPIVKKQGAATVSIEQIRKNNAVWEVRILLRFEKASGALESYRDWALDNPCILYTAEKKPLDYDGRELFRRDEDSVGVAYLFAVESLKDFSLTYETPVLIQKLPVEFELKDIEFP